MIWLIFFAVVALALVFYLTVKRLRRQSTAVRDAVNSPFYKHIVGINHKNPDGTSRQDVISGCHKGEELLLVPEPNNRDHPRAVRVCRKSGELIGYLSTNSGRMAHDLDTGWTFRTTIDDIYPFEENPRKHGVRLRFEVLTRSQGFEASARKNSNGC